MCVPFPRLILLCFLALWALSIHSVACWAHEGHADAESAGAETLKATGVVFEDVNGNGRRDDGERGLSEIRVSNGRSIVKTDDQGRYEIMIDPLDAAVFVIKPRNWMTPVNSLNLPQFYYIHKPNGSPKSRFPGVKPTGSLPESIDFALTRQDEPDTFRALLFGDPQPRDLKEVEYIAHDVVEQVVGEHAHGASLGVTLGDIVFDDLAMMQPLNKVIAMIGIPWYNVLGNHDVNKDAADDRASDETFESIYGPNYYSFDHGPVHFLVLDDVMWARSEDGKQAGYHGGLGPRQMEFIRNDLALIDDNQLVVLMMHIPLIEVKDRKELYRLIEKRPASVSISAHTHYMEHRLVGEEDGWQGPEKHHHIVNVTVCGSWWQGAPDERGIPHATMSDGGPNGYSIMTFDGNKYSLEFRAAGRPSDYQMNLYLPEQITLGSDKPNLLKVNVFNGSHQTKCQFRIVGREQWLPMKPAKGFDPAFEKTRAEEDQLTEKTWRSLPDAHSTPHIWQATLPSDMPLGTHMVEVQATWDDGKTHTARRVVRVASGTP